MKKHRAEERPTLDLMEEAVHLLRSAPFHLFGWYLLGTLPFLLAVLYFWTDMSWSAVAYQHRAEASLGVALLYLWMKCCQSIFALKLRARLTGRETDRISFSDLLGIAIFQAIIQPTKLFLLPLAALATIPFGWVWAFYENATVLGRGESARKFLAKSWRQAGFWPRQNHCALSIYLLLLFVVFLNVALIVFLLPYLLRMFTGVETFFTQSAQSFMNTTSLAVTGAFTYLICDPLLKAIYTLRCFYGDSLRSGEDLAAEMRALPRLGPVLALILALWVIAPRSLAALPALTPAAAVSAVELNDAIERTMKEPQFSWRLPRQIENAGPDRKWPFADAIGRFLKATGRVIGRIMKAIGKWLDEIFSSRVPLPENSTAHGWQTSSRNWLIAVLVLLGGVTLVVVAQTLRQLRLRKSPTSPPASAAPTPDLADDNLSADLLPEEEWLALARACLTKGNRRFALRAFFLAGLAHLGAREVLTLARYKSNRDYRAELRRKARDQPPLLDAFEQNIIAVERVWYGRHTIDQTGVERFETNLEQIREC